MVDYHLILDLVPTISDHYFSKRFADEVSLSPVQQAILAGLGLQRKLIEEVEKELSITSSQVLALFNKTIRKFSQQYQKIQEKAIDYEVYFTFILFFFPFFLIINFNFNFFLHRLKKLSK